MKRTAVKLAGRRFACGAGDSEVETLYPRCYNGFTR